MPAQNLGGRPQKYGTIQQRKQAHKEAIDRYRFYKSQTMKRIEVWVQRPQDLELLKKYSELNQTQVINQLIEIVAKGMNEEEETDIQHKERNLEEMIARLMGVFEKLSW